MSRTFYFLVFLICVLLPNVSCDQPKFTSHEGDFIFHSARDKNITIRLAGDSQFLINDINVLEKLQKITPQSSSLDEIDIELLPTLVETLKTYVQRFTNRLIRVENITAALPSGRITRIHTRVLTLLTQINEIRLKLRTDDCLSIPCKNGGTCYDLYEDFHCECLNTWAGKSCEEDVDECLAFQGTDLGCQNKGVCVNLPGSYRCACVNGFVGMHCREQENDCAKSSTKELCANGACLQANNTLGYTCLCDPGWLKDNLTQSCTVDLNECEQSLVACHTSCINLPGSFMCGPCPTGYSGNGVICRDIDECERNNGGCSMLPKVQCINTEGSYRCGKCPPGWTGDGRSCAQAETNSCDSNNICHPLAKCQYISNVMICVCPEGMTGSGYGQAGCRAGSFNPCSQHICPNGGTCISNGGTPSCLCPFGFEPPNCDASDACSQNPCLNGGTCTSSRNEVTCTCRREFSGSRCQTKRSSCNGVIRDYTGELKYPSDESIYRPNEACAWVIRTDAEFILNVTFHSFDVESDPTCSKDWLQVNDGRSLAFPVIGRFCGRDLPRGGNVLTSHNTLFLWFRTDNATNGAGFSLSWNSIAPICGGLLEVKAQGSGVIKSPGYPGKSPPNRDCEWDIVAPLGKRILLRFFEVVMDRSSNCTKDALLIYDTNELLEQVCDTGIPTPKYSSTNTVKLHFHTDEFREDSLFQVHYEVVEGNPDCGGLFTEHQGKILFTTIQSNCVFLIQQPQDTRVFISFSKIDADATLAMATFKIYDGKTDDSPMIAMTSGGESLPSNLTSSGNHLLIVVQVQMPFAFNQYSATLYEANYKLVCGGEFREPYGGNFKSPNYRNPYYSGLTCIYTIIGPPNSVVIFNIPDFDLSRYNDNCDDDSDYVELYYTFNGPGKRYCKETHIHTIAPSNYLRILFKSNTNPQKRRGIYATYYYDTIGCGGVLRDKEGSFELTDGTQSKKPYCEWILEAPESNVISLDLSYTRRGTKCAPGEVDLRIFLNDTSANGRLVESHCGEDKRVLTILPTNLATIFLRLSSPSVGGAISYGIRANYTFMPRSSNCGGNYTLLSGSIQSPSWPEEYPDLMDCVWVIHAPLASKIELVPKNFSLEPSYGGCRNDYLEIRNGMSKESPLIGTYCGYEIPSHIPSFTNHLYLHFHSDISLSTGGFDIEFQQTTTGCGGSLSSYTGSIASPHYPEISRGPVQCDWKITVSKGSYIDVSIKKMGISTNLCSTEVLRIHDGDDSFTKQISFNCSSTQDADINLKSSNNAIFVRYNLPDIGAAENQQFYLDYKTNCVKTLDAMVGVIESPNFPENYPNNLKCEWTIIGRKTDTISLIFSHFELEKRDIECSYDKFEVIDMKGEEILQNHKICGDMPEMLTSDGNKLVIKFTTDGSNVGNGFRLEYKRNGCGGYKTSMYSTIVSPNYPYSVDDDCEWFIEAAPGMQIQLDISDIHIESNDKNCSSNGLIVKNSKDDTRILLEQCKIQTAPATVTSHGSTMYVRFFSDSLRSRKYLKANYRTKQAQCGGIYTNARGEILSPNYPQNYSSNSYCEWMVTVGTKSSNIILLFKSLDLSNSPNCSSYVEVYDGLQKDENRTFIRKYCSNDSISAQSPAFTKTNQMLVIFSSDDGPPGKGFVLLYAKALCRGELTEKTGILRAREEDGDYCRWTIDNKQRSRITISFTHVECHCEGLTQTECDRSRGVTINTSLEMFRICEQHPPDIIFDGYFIIITSRKITFTAKYSITETSCGGDLTSMRGALASPFYPETYPSNIECIWTIAARSGNYLELNFVEMNISSSENCNQDYLEVRESNASGRLLGVFCSNTIPKDSLQVFEKTWIKFRSSEGSTGKGFKLSWTNAQLNEITGFSGKIKSPPITSVRSENDPFKWRISVPRDNRILLVFKEYNNGLKLFDGFDSSALPIEIQPSPWQVTSGTSVIFLLSDNLILEEFIVEWKALSKETITKNETLQTCNETLTVAHGPIIGVKSPGYPEGYENNLNCQWIIKPDHITRHAVVWLQEVHLEILDNCFADKLKVFSSRNLVDWHKELEICDKNVGPATEIHGTPYLKLELTTDSSVNKTGFEAVVLTACGGNLTNPIGRILDSDVLLTDPFEYVERNCTWHIEVGVGRKIEFAFRFPSIPAEKSSDQCDNYAIIRDGLIEGAPILPPGRICAGTHLNGTIITNSNRATVKYIMKPVRFNTFIKPEISLWNLTYREYSECGGDVRLTTYSSSVLINSPNYPNIPDPHTECIWRVIAPPGEAIQVNFVNSFDFNTRYCSKEFVEFRDGATEMARHLGKYCVRPGTIRTSDNVLYMRFFTDIAEPRNGFQANVSITTCGGMFTQYSNVITSANYPAPGGYPANSVCEYVIKVSSFARVNMTFLDVHLPYDVTNLNASDNIRIYQIFQSEGSRIEDQLAVIYGNMTSPPALQIDSNEILIRFSSFKPNTKFRGFRLRYERIYGVCFRDVSAESGELSLSIAPRRSSMFILCRWKITVPKGKRVKLDILDVDGGSTSLSSGRNFRTTFYNDFQMLSRITMLMLNNITQSSSISSSDNRMFVRLFGAHSTSLRRMRVSYSSPDDSPCPDDITSDTGTMKLGQLERETNFFCTLDFVLNGAQTLAFNVSRLTVENLDQRLPYFAVRFRDDVTRENLRVLNTNQTNEIVALASKRGSVNILQNDGVRIKELEAFYKKHACGGSYRVGQTFEISMPNITAGYGSLDCAWHLSTSFNENGFDWSANFTFTLPCEDEYATIHSGPSSEHLEVAKLCKGETFDTKRLRTEHMFVHYHTASFSLSSQLFIKFQRATNCGGEKINVHFKEFLKFSSIDYKNNLECVWNVATTEGYYLSVEFTGRFYIEESKNCTKDFLEIKNYENGDYVTMQRYCGRNLPSVVNTTSSKLQFIFRSDEANTGDGFSLTIKNTCYAVFNVTSQPQFIKYPPRWSMIIPRLSCDYILQSESEKFIQVKFNKFQLGFQNRCSLTQLTAKKQVSDGYTVEVGPYCKDNAVKELRASKFISIHYQAVFETAGYEIEFALEDCGGHVSKPMWINSLRNEDGDRYANNMNCVWNISAPAGENIVILFKYLVLEEVTSCSLDYVAIYEGSQIDHTKRIANMCGNYTTNAPSVYIGSDSAVLVAASDSSVTSDGFSARIMFSKACDERITLTEANSPVEINRNYSLNLIDEVMACSLRVMGPPGFRIEVEVKEININWPGNRCPIPCNDCEYIEVIDSVKGGGMVLGRYCSLGTLKPKLTSSFKDVVIRTNFERPRNSQFKVKLRLVPADCGSQSEYFLEDESGIQIVPLKKPNGLYPPNVHCTWTINAKSAFNIKFTEFNLQNKSDTTGECLDYVMVKSKHNYYSTRFSEHCGSIKSYVVHIMGTDSASAEITFHTDEAIESTGFILTATIANFCNRSYTETSGAIFGNIKTDTSCLSDITLPENYTVNIYMPSMYISSSTNCTSSYIRAYDKKTNLIVFEECEENYSGQKIFTSTNQIRLDTKSTSSDGEMYYYGSPKSQLPGCGGNLEMNQGYLNSPPYAQYKNASNCRWNIITTAPNLIELIFHDFNMGTVCKADYLNIIETASNGSERVTRHYCEQETIQNYKSESNRVGIVAVTAADFDGTGFSIFFRALSESARRNVKTDFDNDES